MRTVSHFKGCNQIRKQTAPLQDRGRILQGSLVGHGVHINLIRQVPASQGPLRWQMAPMRAIARYNLAHEPTEGPHAITRIRRSLAAERERPDRYRLPSLGVSSASRPPQRGSGKTTTRDVPPPRTWRWWPQLLDVDPEWLRHGDPPVLLRFPPPNWSTNCGRGD